MEEIRKGIAELNIVERLLKRIQKKLGEFDKESRKVVKLRRLIQGDIHVTNTYRSLGG